MTTKKQIQPSVYQQAIYNWVEHGSGNAIINAVAGSGKTFTIIEATKHIPDHLKVLMVAFNIRAAKDLSDKAPRHVEARTIHSLGMGCLYSHWNARPIVEEPKTWKLIRQFLTEDDVTVYGSFVNKLVEHAKNDGLWALYQEQEGDENQVWVDLIEHQDLALDHEAGIVARGIELAREIHSEGINLAEQQHIIDFNDMMFLPAYLKLNPKRYDWVFIDEAQDTNDTRRDLVRKAMKQGGRFVAVGDRNQAIYGFTGASIDAMDLIKKEFNCVEFPLSVNYRSGRKIIALAQEYVPEITAHDGACDGVVEHINDEQRLETLRQLSPADVVLCRFTRPLVSIAYELINDGIGCRILGREIGVGLINLTNKMKARDIHELNAKLATFREEEYQKLIQRDQEARAEAHWDRVSSLLFIIDNCVDLHDVIPAIEHLFNQDEGVLTLSTIHKAKGGKWSTAMIIERDGMPCQWAKQEWQQQQEQNLIYVAITRAKERLILHYGDRN